MKNKKNEPDDHRDDSNKSPADETEQCDRHRIALFEKLLNSLMEFSEKGGDLKKLADDIDREIFSQNKKEPPENKGKAL